MAQVTMEQTPLWADIRDIMQAKSKATRFEYRAMLHTEAEDLVILKVLTFDVVRDYVNNIGDLVHISFQMGLGDYVTRLFPYRTNLELTIKKIKLTDFNETKTDDSIISVTRYKAVFLVGDNMVLTGTEYEHADTETLNNIEVATVKLQLLDRSLEVIRIRQTHGIFNKVTQKQLIHTLLAGESLKVQIDGKPSIDGINIIEPDNKEIRKIVIIPSSTEVTRLPTFLQERMGGVYNAGIGNYLQKYKKKVLWFVFPTADTKRFESTQDDKVMFYAMPEDRYSALDRTYDVQANVVKVLVTGQRKYTDSADVDYMNKGSGFRMEDARAYMTKPIVIKEDGPWAARGRLNTEVVTEDRKDGLNYARRTAASSNPFKEYSTVNARNLSRIDIVWENSDPDLIYPGMTCKYIFLDEGKPVFLMGTVAFIQSTTQLQGQGIAGKTYMTNSALVLLCEQKVKTRPLPKQDPRGGIF